MFIIGKKGFELNKNSFQRKNVYEVKIPLASFNFALYVILLPFLILMCLPILMYFIVKCRPQVIHCRNLLSTFIALSVRKIFKLKYKIISDPRSVYPEEGVIINRWRLNGFNYKTWKFIESYTFKNVDVCVGLSESFKLYLLNFNKKSIYIPAVVNDNMFFDFRIRESKRREFNLTENDLVFLYVGSIGLWHDIESLIYMFSEVKNKFKTFNCKIIALSGSPDLKERLRLEVGDDCLLCSTVSPAFVSEYLHLADFGLVPGSNKVGFHYDLLYRTMISSKASEYICAGLPIICNSRISGLCDYITKSNLGYILDFETHSFNYNSIVNYNNEDRERISKWGLKEFGLKNVKMKLISIYR